MKILKFGGTSLENAGRIDRVTTIIRNLVQSKEQIAVVVSAFGGVTDLLIQAAKKAAIGDGRYSELEQQIEDRHVHLIRELITVQNQSHALAHIIRQLNDLHDVLHGVFLVRELSARVLDFIMSFGERLSAFIVAEVLKEKNITAQFLDARQLIKTNDRFGQAQVLWPDTLANIQQYFQKQNALQVITGFIASTLKNETTTLGRSGSDYTASIIGAALNAQEIQIWSDVNGVMTADPRQVPEAFTLPRLTYEEAMELSHFGAQVIHPRTMQPALDKKIPIRIKNTLNVKHPGTVISAQANAWPYPIKAISSLDAIALVSVIGSGMIGVTGIAGRIFTALARKGINIILISQASSEHSICFGVLPASATPARKALERELKLELMEKTVNKIQVENDLSVIAVVGEKMRRTRGIAGRAFSALGHSGINIVAIAQGSSELNISLVVEQKDLTAALQAIHKEFFNLQQETNR
ncbi:aspartate kinase [Calditrichota bacterium GD2]